MGKGRKEDNLFGFQNQVRPYQRWAWQGSEQQHWRQLQQWRWIPISTWWLFFPVSELYATPRMWPLNPQGTDTMWIVATFHCRICSSCCPTLPLPLSFYTPPERTLSGMLAWMSHHLIPITKTKIKFISSTRCFCDLHNHTHAQNLEYVKNSCVLINCYIYHLPSHSKEISWVSLSRFCYNPYLMTWSVP